MYASMLNLKNKKNMKKSGFRFSDIFIAGLSRLKTFNEIPQIIRKSDNKMAEQSAKRASTPMQIRKQTVFSCCVTMVYCFNNRLCLAGTIQYNRLRQVYLRPTHKHTNAAN